MCNEPVTFGGGITIEKAGCFDAASARKKPRPSHNRYHRLSTSFASYVLEISTFIDSLQLFAYDLLRDIGHNIPGNAFDDGRRQPLDHPVGNAVDVFVANGAYNFFRFLFEDRKRH